MTKFIPYPFYHDDVPFDISHIFADEKPAGKHGFMKIEGRKFFFEDGAPARFWGTNVNSGACFPDHDYAEIFAKRIAKLGLNIVRLHQLDAEWSTVNIFNFTKGKRRLDASFDPESMDRLDYFVHCLKKEGIYCILDMVTYRRYKSAEGVENAEALGDNARPMAVFNQKLIDLQKDYITRIWTHVNPYTGLAYCDDPVFVMTQFTCENELFARYAPLPEPYATEFRDRYAAWLKEHNYEKSLEDFDYYNQEDEQLLIFKEELQEKYYRQMYDHMRSVGIKIPIAGTNWTTYPINTKTQRVCDFFENHGYYNDWQWGEFEKRRANRAITHKEPSYLARGCATAASDMPTYFSEWDMVWPNEYRAESPIYTAAIGRLQGWNGFSIHTYAYSSRTDRMDMLGKEIASEKIGGTPYRQGIFSTWNDPAKFGLFYHAALITRRGDVKESENMITVKPIGKLKFNWNDLRANIERCCVVSDYSFDTEVTPEYETLPDEIMSDTGELYINRDKNYGWVNTDNTKCAYGFLGKNGKIDLSGVNVTCETDFAVVAMSTLTDEKICNSDNILLTTVGRANNTDFKFEHELMTDYGKPPVLIEVIRAEIEIKTDVTGLNVWAISPEGFYIGLVPSTYENGVLKFTVGESAQSMYYHIVKE